MEKLSNLRSEPSTAQESLSPMGILTTHLDAAYNLARWLLRDQTEAEDAVQEAYLRAFRHSKSFRGGHGRAWLLTIVRNCCYDRLKEGAVFTDGIFEEEAYASETMLNQESALLQRERAEQVRRAFEKLPAHLREVVALREFEEMSYGEIAAVVGIPMGTVMSRLSRGRLQLKQMVSLGCEGKGAV